MTHFVIISPKIVLRKLMSIVFEKLTDDGSVRELMSHIFRMDETELTDRLAGYGLELHQFNLKNYNQLVEERKHVF